MVLLSICTAADGRQTAHRLLDRAVQSFCGITQRPPIARTTEGKPYFPDHPALHFNISHSGPFALCGVGHVPLGVDIECLHQRKPGLPRHVLCEHEYRWFLARGAKWEDFYTLWTLKESRCKQEGMGLRSPPRTIAVPLLDAGGAAELDGLSFRAYSGEGWRAAVCAPAGTTLPAGPIALAD
ncbi:MAG: 4'-phosphopantetheinyl transferase superfamily protein [Oscillospiraceae bacterium]|nr:4'-phosphopantetheinyl transferase superfamily protein [Oscillospiraceae bacterium]